MQLRKHLLAALLVFQGCGFLVAQPTCTDAFAVFARALYSSGALRAEASNYTVLYSTPVAPQFFCEKVAYNEVLTLNFSLAQQAPDTDWINVIGIEEKNTQILFRLKAHHSGNWYSGTITLQKEGSTVSWLNTSLVNSVD